MRVRTKRRPPRISTIDALRGVIASGLTTPFAIALAVGTSEHRMKLLLVSRIPPDDAELATMEKLAKNYRRAVKLVNVETAKGRL